MPFSDSVHSEADGNSLGIVIVNWNTGRRLHECMASIARAGLPPGWTLDRVVVVDNASKDGSAEALPDPGCKLEVIHNSANLGFAAACNQGASRCRARLLLFLNPDTQLFYGSLKSPILRLVDRCDDGVGIVGIRLIDERGHTTRCCARFPRGWHFVAHALALDRLWPSLSHLMLDWDHGSSRRVDQVIGAFFMTSQELFERLGGFDQRYFVYFEEVDFSFRAYQLGYHTEYIAEAHAMHVGGVSSGRVLDRRLMYSLRSRLIYARAHFGFLERGAVWMATWVLEPLARLTLAVVRARRDEALAIVRGYWLLLCHAGPGARGASGEPMSRRQGAGQ